MEETKKKVALVTGASSGIGRAISARLVALGYEVYGIGRQFPAEIPEVSLNAADLHAGTRPQTSPAPEADAAADAAEKPMHQAGVETNAVAVLPATFHPVVCDLLDTKKLPSVVASLQKEWKQEKRTLALLVNNAGTAYYGLHEELRPEGISEMVRVNLEVPMLLTQQLLRTLKQNHGAIINISSVTAIGSNPHGVAYGATKAGLLSFSRSLFDEARKYGVRVTAILPDMTDTQLYRHADFEADPAMDAHLEAEDVADAVEYALTTRAGTCVPEIILRPQLHRIMKKA